MRRRRHGRPTARAILLACVGMLATAGAAEAAKVPPLAQVPELRDAARSAELTAARAPLAETMRALRERVKAWQARCRGLDDTTDAGRACLAEKAEIEAAQASLAPVVDRFNARVEVAQAVDVRQAELERLTAFRDGLTRILERGKDDATWRRELEDWAARSEDAQRDAIAASLSLVLGSGGPLDEAIRNHHEAATEVYQVFRKNSAVLEAVGGRLETAIRATRGTAALQELHGLLRGVDDALRAAFQAETAAADAFRFLNQAASSVTKANRVLKNLGPALDAAARREVDAALREAAVGAAKVAGSLATSRLIDTLAKQGNAELANRVRLAKWVVEYGLAGIEFGVSWWRVEEGLRQLDDRNAALRQVQLRHGQAVDDRNEVRREIEALEASQAGDAAAMRQAVQAADATLRARTARRRP